MATFSCSLLDLQRGDAHRQLQQLMELTQERHEVPIQELASILAKYQECELLYRQWERICYDASMVGDPLPDFPDLDQLTSLECGIVGFIYRRQLH
jgi:hypothetical protein